MKRGLVRTDNEFKYLNYKSLVMVVVIWDDLISHPYFIVHLFFCQKGHPV